MMNDVNMRRGYIFAGNKGHGRQVIDKTEALNIILNPPPQFVLSIPFSFKKHHWLYAGISTSKKAYLGIDERTVIIDYTADFSPQDAVSSILELFNLGLNKTQIIFRKYSYQHAGPLKKIIEIDNRLKDYRSTGALDLLCRLMQCPTLKPDNKMEVKMLNESERYAISLLADIAMNSQLRIAYRTHFWSQIYAQYINRYKNYPFNVFVSKLMEKTISCGDDISQKMIQTITESQQCEIMDALRNETALILAFARDAVISHKKNNKQKAKFKEDLHDTMNYQASDHLAYTTDSDGSIMLMGNSEENEAGAEEETDENNG